MTTARQIIDDALTFRLNRLSPGESADADTDAVCLRALNSIVDEMNGDGSLLWREILTASSTISSATGTLGSTWSTLDPGDKILGASYAYGGLDWQLEQATMEQYQAEPQKTLAGLPSYFAFDGYATVYFWPVPSSIVVTLRTKEAAQEFADTTTEYTMPAGYRSFFCDLLAEKVAPVMGGVTPIIAKSASAARRRILAMNINPAIVDTAGTAGLRYSILRGY